MRVLFDTNVVLDVLLERAPHALDAARLFTWVERGKVEGLICATTVTTIHYLATKAVKPKAAKRHLRHLLDLFQVAAVDGAVLAAALDLPFSDYEDAVLYEAARAAGAVGIVTRNRADFKRASLPIYDPPELLGLLQTIKPT